MNLYSASNEHKWRKVAPSIINTLKLFVGPITRCHQIAISGQAVWHWESREGASEVAQKTMDFPTFFPPTITKTYAFDGVYTCLGEYRMHLM